MPVRHRALAAAVAVIWGVNFIVTDLGLRDVPPLVLTALRFIACGLPLVFLVPKPTAKARHVIAYGIALGADYGLLFTAQAHGMPAGMASLVLQSQALFSILLATTTLGERIRPTQLGGVLVASGGISLLAWGRGENTTALGYALTLGAAAAWAVANVIARASGEQRPLSMLVYSSLVPPVPLLGLACVLSGPQAVTHTLGHLSVRGLLAIGFFAYLSTLLGFGSWNHLLARYPVPRVAPFSLLVPVVGIAASASLLGEPVTAVVLIASVIVLTGLALIAQVPRRDGTADEHKFGRTSMSYAAERTALDAKLRNIDVLCQRSQSAAKVVGRPNKIE